MVPSLRGCLGTLLAVSVLLHQTRSFVIQPQPEGFGAVVQDLDVSNLLHPADRGSVAPTVDALKTALHTHHYLLFRGQDLTPFQQMDFAALFGALFDETLHPNRKKWKGEIDARIAVFSNHEDYGLVNVGIEGFHSDGNVTPLPHAATVIYGERVIEGGDTLLAPLDRVLAAVEPQSLLDGVDFVSAHADVRHPLVYPHPSTGRMTMIFGLGSLSGLYWRDGREMSQEQTDEVTAAIDKAIESLPPYRHKWRVGDLLMLDNLGLCHKAVPGTQDTSKGIRILRRVTIAGTNTPARRSPMSSYVHACDADSGVCLVSLARTNSTTVPAATGSFSSTSEAQTRCKVALDESAELANLQTPALGDLAARIVEEVGRPHWLGATEADGVVTWGPGLNGAAAPADTWLSYPFDETSGQPNDCDGPASEPCLFVGPHGQWFDFACGPKSAPGTTPGPEITWSNGERRMFDIEPLCMVRRSVWESSTGNTTTSSIEAGGL